jgi:DNA replication protein DnaD
MDNLKLFLGDFGCSEDVIKLALKKCKLNIEETIFIVTEPD